MNKLNSRKVLSISMMAMAVLFVTLSVRLWAREASEAKKVVMVIAKVNFRDEELREPKKILEAHAIKVTIASSSLALARGMLGAKVKPDILLSKVKVDDYDAVIFVGGMGAKEYWNDSTAHRIAREAIKRGKVVGAICIAPVILANAEVLSGKKATVWSGVAGKLKAKGAIYTGSSVQVDGRIITANGPRAAKSFGQAILKALTIKPSPTKSVR